MTKLLQNILATDMSDVKKSARDAALFAAALFLTTFLGGLDAHSIFANSWSSAAQAAMNGIDAVYSAWLALCMPMLMRTVRPARNV